MKCYVQKGKSNQRIRKISLFGINSITHLKDYIRLEFGWNSDQQFKISYATSDNNSIIEINENDFNFLTTVSLSYFLLTDTPLDV